MGLISAIGASVRREYIFITGMRATLKRLKHIDPKSDFLMTDEIEQAVDRFTDNHAFICNDRHWTFAQFDRYANKVANWATAQGYRRGDTLGIYCHNRLEYVALWFGLSKVGVIGALLNDALVGQSLTHCLDVADIRALICPPALLDNAKTALAAMSKDTPLWCLDGVSDGAAQDFDAALANVSDSRPDRQMRSGIIAGDPALKMFTSGTTGLPKAANVSHARAQRYMNSFCALVGSNERDRMMMVLPLYHATGGLCGVGTVLLCGGAVIVEKQFSASRFWAQAVRQGATQFMYVGELCRFLVGTPPCKEEQHHKIRAIIGNGLRPEVWVRFRDRFHIRKIVEFYGSTEGNVGLVNADGQVGAMGRIPWYARRSFNLDLVKHDYASLEPVRGPDGFCIRCKVDEPGEGIGRIDKDDARFRFDGYNDKEETTKKLLKNVFRSGDLYFRTGDLMRRDRHGYYYFVDRIGDTFRWMAENASASAVAGAFAGFDGVGQANVYGVEVPHYDGRAGMAAVVTKGPIDFAALYAHLAAQLPAYARPVFLRIQQQANTTTTFKFKKTDLVEQGFDPQKTDDPLYVIDRAARTYVPLTMQVYTAILGGKMRL